MRRIIALALGLTAAVAVMTATHATAQSPQTLKVAVAQRGFWNSSFVEFALQQGFFKQEGLEIEILYTEGGASTLMPVVSGSLDIAMTNGTLGVIAAFAKGMPVKIISAEATGAPDAFWYARPESGIKSIRDTNGKTVAFSSPGSSTNLIILQLVNQEKATPKLVADRRRAGNADAGDERPDRRRLVGAAVRAAAGRRRPRADHRARLATSRRSATRPSASTSPTPMRSRQKRDAFVRYMRALSRAIDWAYTGDAAIDAYAADRQGAARARAAHARRVLSEGIAAARRGEGTRPHAQAGGGVQVHHRRRCSAADVQSKLIDILYKPGS